MLLMQQAGPGVLSLSSLASDELTGFLRKTENLVTQERLAPVIVYWSSKDAGPLLPEEKRLRELKRESFFLATFSEGREEGHEELCFLVQSQELCLIAYSLEERYQSGNPLYKSAGSVDPQVVGQCFSTMLPLWQFIDLGQANGLEEALINLGQTASTPALVQSCRRNWPVVKMPIRPTKEWEVLESAYSARLKSGELPLQALLEEGLEAGLLSPGPSKASPAGLPGGVDAGDGEASVTAPREMKPAEAMPCREAVKPHARQARPAEREAVIPLAAQQIIREMISQLRHSDDISAILQLAIERLTRVTGAHRGLIWQVIGEEELTVTNEYSAVGRNCFAGEELGHEESTAIVVEFLARFPDESGGGVISVSDTIKDTRLRKLSPGLSSMLEMAEVRARLVCQLRCRGVFSGFVELQECRQPRQWSEAEADVLQSVAEVLSVVVQQSHDQSKIELDAREMKLINEISSLFRESKGQKSQDMLIKSVRRVAEHTSFERCQIYLFDAEAEELVPQIVDSSNGASPVSLADKESPFVVVYQTGREKSFNPIYARKPDAYFGKDFALVVPLVSESEKVGVLALWKRAADAPAFKPKEQQLAKVVSGQLAAHIRADRAIAQIRADQAREHLINKVSDQIRESLKQVDQIMETLVESLASHFELSFCAVSLFDEQSGKFVMTKRAGGEEEFSPDDGSDGKEDASPSELISVSMLEELKQGKMIFLKAGELKRKLRRLELGLPSGARSVTLVPLIYGGEFKAALCMVSDTRTRPWPVKDRKMVKDLADRVAVVASHAELFAQVEQQAVTDPMTGLFNRRHFTQQLSREIDRFQRFGHPFSYVIVDLDFLKMINDTLGHQYGDVAIKHIAAVLKRTTRDVDTTARYGGEEFVVLLPETDAIAARLVAQRICNALKEKPVSELSERKTELEEKIAAAVDSDKIGDADAERLRSCIVTASIGVATFPTDAQERERLAELADQALYLAKHRGPEGEK